MKGHAKSLLAPSALAAVVAVGIAMGQPVGTPAGPTLADIARQMGMRNVSMHDPSTICKCGDEYYIYPTGATMFHSKDLITWTQGTSPTAGLTQAWPAAARSGWTPPPSPPPANAATAVPAGGAAPAAGRGGRGGGGGNFWAPDVIKVKDKYFIFLSTSGFGVNNSAIGVISSPTLNPADPAYKFTEGGLIVRSDTRDDFNCIDPAALYDDDGKLWLSFGSFWGGIKLLELNPDTGLRIAPNSPMYHLAHFDSIEASYIYKHDGNYFLFADWGMCCHGATSTYNMRVGRADKVTGPYLDQEGKDMATGGGTNFMDIHYGPKVGNGYAIVGNGHAGIIVKDGKFYISSHVESNACGLPAGTAGSGTLSIRPLTWDEKGWPVADSGSDHMFDAKTRKFVADRCLHGRLPPRNLEALWLAKQNGDPFVAQTISMDLLTSSDEMLQGYGEEIANGNPDVLANVRAHQRVFQRVGFFAQLDGGDCLAFDFQSGGPEDPPVVVLDTEGQYKWLGINLAESIVRIAGEENAKVARIWLASHGMTLGNLGELGSSTQFLPSIQNWHTRLYHEFLGKPRKVPAMSAEPAKADDPTTWLMRPGDEVHQALNDLLKSGSGTHPSRQWVRCDGNGRVSTIWFHMMKQTESTPVHGVTFGMKTNQVVSLLDAQSKKGDGWLSFAIESTRLRGGFEDDRVNEICLLVEDI